MTRWVALCGGLAIGRALAAGYLLDARLVPDTSLYAAGGFGLFPSPLGRLIGSGGLDGLIVVNAIAAGVLVLLVAKLALELGARSGTRAALLALLVPASFWTAFPDADALGAVFIVAAVWMGLRGRERASDGLLGLAAASHLALAPIVLAWLLWRRAWLVLAGIVAIAGGLLIWSPYRAIVAAPDLAALGGTITATGSLLLVAPVVVVALWRRAHPGLLMALTLGTIATIFLVLCVEPAPFLSRYGLPLAMVGCALSVSPGRGVRASA